MLDGIIVLFHSVSSILNIMGLVYGLVEIKLGGDDLIDEGAETLLKLSGKIDTKRMKAPSFMMVLVGVGKYAYRREDGVYVVPVGCLKD